jgi:hypothetical protein
MKEWTARTFALHQSSLAAGSLSATCEGRALGSREGLDALLKERVRKSAHAAALRWALAVQSAAQKAP